MRNFLLSIFYFLFSKKRGQSLIEVLVALSIGAFLIIAAASLIAPALRINAQTARAQTAAALAKALLDNLSVWADGDWHNIANLSVGSAYHYYLNASSSPFSVSAGDESIAVSTATYKRFFYVDDVCRDASGNIASPPCNSPFHYDPSTKKITVGYSWLGAATATIPAYLTRSSDRIFMQTDWSGGSNQAGPITSANSKFASSTANINYSSSGLIYLSL